MESLITRRVWRRRILCVEGSLYINLEEEGQWITIPFNFPKWITFLSTKSCYFFNIISTPSSVGIQLFCKSIASSIDFMSSNVYFWVFQEASSRVADNFQRDWLLQHVTIQIILSYSVGSGFSRIKYFKTVLDRLNSCETEKKNC
jgi:hypothetical protein